MSGVEKALWMLCVLLAFLAGHYVAYVRYGVCGGS